MKVKQMIEELKKCDPDAELSVAYSGYYETCVCDILKPDPFNKDGTKAKDICIAEVETEY